MKSREALLFAGGSLSWAVAQWWLVWLFARFAGGAGAVGEYSLTLAVVTPIFVLGQFGLRTVYLTLRTQQPWSSYLTLRIGGIVLSVVVIFVYFFLTSEGDPRLWGAVVFLKCMDAYVDLLFGKIQRENRLMQIGVLSLAKSIGTALVATAAVLSTESMSLAIFGAGIISAGIAILTHRIPTGTNDQYVSIATTSGYREILRAGLPTTIAEGFASVSKYLPLMFLAFIADESVAGIFATAAYLFTLAGMSGAILKNVLITSLRLTLENEGVDQLLKRAHRIANVLGMSGIVASPIIIFAGSPVLEFLYGQGFAFSYGELAILAFGTIAIVPGYIYSAVLNVLNRYDGQAWAWFGALMFGLALGVGMIFSPDIPALVLALTIAFAINWGRLIGVVALTISAKHRRE